MTDEEKAKEYKIKGWVARDEDGYLNLFLYDKPFNQNGSWYGIRDVINLPYKKFASLKFQNSPIEVELSIKQV